MQNAQASKGNSGARKARIRFNGLEPGDERPNIALRFIGQDGKTLHTSPVDAEGNFDLPTADAMKNARRVVIGPAGENADAADPDSLLYYRADQFERLIANSALNLASSVWKRWHFHIQCVSGHVRKCRRGPWWFHELHQLAVVPEAQAALSLKATALSALDANAAKTLPELIPWPFRCQTVCKGVVEVYRRTCCCRPWIIDDPRIPDLIRHLKEIVKVIPIPEFPPKPNPPDPPYEIERAFFKDGALDEMALNAHADVRALETLPKAEVLAYVNDRPYLRCFGFYSCGAPTKVAEGFIGPDGRFNLCWLEPWRILRLGCHDEYAYIVKQVIGGVPVTIYNGVAAGIWFAPGDDALLTSYSPFAVACRDNGDTSGEAYVYLDLIGDTGAWNLKTPDADGWNSVMAPAYNDGLAFPAPTPAAANGANLNRNWGGTLKLWYLFSESLRGVGGKYYRISVTEADSAGNPVGAPSYITDGLSWEKSSLSGGIITVSSVTLGPFTVGGQDHLYLIPYDGDLIPSNEDWNGNQYHALLNTTDPRWSDPTKRHLVTLEIFDAAGQRLRPNAALPSGAPGAEGTAPFFFRRRYQDLGPTADVPYAALTHLFWWDNRLPKARIVNLQQNGLVSTAECQFLHGVGGSTFGIGYQAYHPNEMFQLSHSISWQRGLGHTAGWWGSLTPAGGGYQNVGMPPPPDNYGSSGTNSFDAMLRTDLDSTREKCAFTVSLTTYAKTTDGENLGNPYDSDSAAFVLDIS